MQNRKCTTEKYNFDATKQHINKWFQQHKYHIKNNNTEHSGFTLKFYSTILIIINETLSNLYIESYTTSVNTESTFEGVTSFNNLWFKYFFYSLLNLSVRKILRNSEWQSQVLNFMNFGQAIWIWCARMEMSNISWTEIYNCSMF